MAQTSFYSGYVGVAYICQRLADLLDEPVLVERALELLDRLADVDLESQGLDLLNGYAGAIPALLYLGRAHRRQDLLDRAVLHGERLLKTARRSPFGWSWPTMSHALKRQSEVPDLLGFSHGTSGIAWALLELHIETRDDRFREGIEQAFCYERHWFDSEHQNWPDFRPLHDNTASSKQEPAFMTAWCHGAPGVGLARLRAYQALGNGVYRQEAELAVQTTARSVEQALTSSQASFCLCHGLAGNADVLLYADRILNTPGYRQLAEQAGCFGAERYHANQASWPCGVMGGGETPGLFLGLAGIGYFYLRLHQPDAVPPITIPLPPD
jgi:lantibiotic modifying enzyme